MRQKEMKWEKKSENPMLKKNKMSPDARLAELLFKAGFLLLIWWVVSEIRYAGQNAHYTQGAQLGWFFYFAVSALAWRAYKKQSVNYAASAHAAVALILIKFVWGLDAYVWIAGAAVAFLLSKWKKASARRAMEFLVGYWALLFWSGEVGGNGAFYDKAAYALGPEGINRALSHWLIMYVAGASFVFWLFWMRGKKPKVAEMPLYEAKKREMAEKRAAEAKKREPQTDSSKAKDDGYFRRAKLFFKDKLRVFFYKKAS